MSQLTKVTSHPANILLLMSGSIACAKASGLISTWVKQGHDVEVACTRSVSHFVGHATLEGFSGRPVLADTFAPGQVMDHIRLARWADIVIAAPATSNLINKLAAGIADDAVTSLWQAAYGHNKPMYIVPAMNTYMWEYPATRASVQRLQSWGIHVLPTAEGDLACGETGAGRMLEPEAIMDYLDNARSRPPGKRVLITAGGTREPIDAVRYIGNSSTGRTGAALADALAGKGYEVTWLGAEQAIRPRTTISQETYVTFQDLETALRRLLASQPFDLVIHAAAVSDFSVDRIEVNGAAREVTATKLPSSAGLSLHLKPNPKLLDQLRLWSVKPDIRIIGFKLTHGADPEQRKRLVDKMLAGATTDAVVHNDLEDVNGGQHPYTLYLPHTGGVHCADSQELASRIENLMENNA